MQALSVPVHSLAPLISPTYWSIKMKRLNPTTGLLFKHGDVREDGRVFAAYRISIPIKKDGFYSETWYTPEKFKHRVLRGYKRKAKKVMTAKGRAAHLYQGAKTRSNKNNLPIDITANWIEKKLDLGVCELTGLPFDFSPPKKTQYNPYSPSVDRINSNRGYTKRNTRIVLTAVNVALNQYGEKIMLPILEALVKGIKKNAKKI